MNDNELRVDFDDLELTDELIHYWQGKPFTGIAYEYGAEGKLLSEMSFVDGKEQGVAHEWYPSGQLKEEKEYREGSLHGQSQEWYKNGLLKSLSHYEYGILVDRKEWDKQGNLVKEVTIGEDNNLYSILKMRRQRDTKAN